MTNLAIWWHASHQFNRLKCLSMIKTHYSIDFFCNRSNHVAIHLHGKEKSWNQRSCSIVLSHLPHVSPSGVGCAHVKSTNLQHATLGFHVVSISLAGCAHTTTKHEFRLLEGGRKNSSENYASFIRNTDWERMFNPSRITAISWP